MLAVPLCLLYEVGIFVAQFVEKRKPAADAGAGAGGG
jgi:Sec-independent protein secretion pathway component TatC